MKKLDIFEKEILAEFDKGLLKSTAPSKAKFKAAASAILSKESG